MSVISWLALQNGDQNDPDAYYYGAESPTDGVRLTGTKVDGVAIVIDPLNRSAAINILADMA